MLVKQPLLEILQKYLHLYVERDEKENPLYIYYTDANDKKKKKKNAYTPGVDGMVIKEDYQTFLENDQLKLAGYLKVKE